MSKENDQSDNSWDDEDEQPRHPSHPSRRLRPRGVPGAGEIYEEYDEPSPKHSRTSRRAHDEALARVRQRPRQPLYPEQTEPRAKPPAPKPRRAIPRNEQEADYLSQTARLRRDEDDYPSQTARLRRELEGGYAYQQPSTADRQANARAEEPYEAYEEYEEYAAQKAARHRRAQFAQRPPQRRRQRGNFGSNLLAGCIGVLLTFVVIIAVGAYFLLHNTPLGQSFGKSIYTQQVSQAITLGNASELIVKNQIGNVSVSFGNSSSLTSVRKVQAGSQSEADSQFTKITLNTQQISQGADPACTASSCLLITTTLPPNTSSGGLFGSANSSSIDLALILPTSFQSSTPTTPYILDASTISGNLAINGFNGILNLTSDSGTISVQHTFIFAGTCLQTMQGDIAVGQGSVFDLNHASNQIPCSPTSSSGVHPWFNITSGRGNVNITLTTLSTNLLFDANTNNGKIGDDFGLNIPSTSDGSASYHGPLLANSTPTASLYVFTSTGNIEIQQQH